MPLRREGRYTDGCYENMRLAEVQIGDARHQALSCLTRMASPGRRCRAATATSTQGYVCDEAGGDRRRDSRGLAEMKVPAGHYLMIGDNRDNSADSRCLGLRAGEHLVGKPAGSGSISTCSDPAVRPGAGSVERIE